MYKRCNKLRITHEYTDLLGMLVLQNTPESAWIKPPGTLEPIRYPNGDLSSKTGVSSILFDRQVGTGRREYDDRGNRRGAKR
ncbi:hypothetical protein ANCCAN_26025 [Ancylostoma caninum]|uniref:Uncharacterized protein n=1 Tax=Ancylostoma caninum TaxID=29170 RepID=A0A368F833_ANCCA|nr:hypothetical protein ANCCAN_26025 [Ancylostoma caninum]